MKKKENQVNQEHRLLDLYTRLQSGQVIYKQEEAERFRVNERTIQRDFECIRAYLAEQSMQGARQSELIYDRQKNGYHLQTGGSSAMSNSEILAVSKILLESRAFTKNEMDTILQKILRGCVPAQEQSTVSDLILNETFHYVPPRHSTELLERLWDLGQAVRQNIFIELHYRRMDGSLVSSRIVEPVSILFSEFYFYLVAYNMVPSPSGRLTEAHDYPSYYRVDRIQQYSLKKEHFTVQYSRRFESGELRKRVQFMYGGHLQQVQFLYRGPSIEAVYDRLPTATASENAPGEYLVSAEVFGDGIIQWLLSQGKNVEVLKPEELKRSLTAHIQIMKDYYHL